MEMENTSMETKYPYCNPEIWGGIESTINRVGDEFRDQLMDSSHYSRPGDIKLFASLGIKKLRYPILWEKHQPVEGKKPDWTWAENQLNQIRDSDMDVIAGLLHHGSGPLFTDLLDEGFAEKFADYASQVVIKFPWIEYYTPINEPLTTARFSGLYGFWYPHHKDPLAFAKMFLNQLKGTILAMQAIRVVNPTARLVQTEDLSRIHCSPRLQYQADFENARRWLTYDVLCGKLDKKHELYDYFIGLGIAEKELTFFIDNPCPPDIIGFNYYVTSERYLDEQHENYDLSRHGGNGRDTYVDTEAVRIQPLAGIGELLKEAWERFSIPMAITECHLNCSREEQLRWFKETWDTAAALCKDGIEVRAVTAWSMLGSYDWNSLLINKNGHYEPGTFDVQNGKPRPTALAKLIKSIARDENYKHPLLQSPGWWHTIHANDKDDCKTISKTPPVLIIGRNGTLGQAFARICKRRSIPAIALSRQDVDISKPEEIQEAISLYRPWAIINASGYVRVDDAEMNSNECFAVNSTGPGLLAGICQQQAIRFMSFSSDLVFDGQKNAPYYEGDEVNPLNVYGASKADGELLIRAANPGALVIRTSAFFGPWDQYNFVYNVLDSLKKGDQLHVLSDVIVSPTYVPDLAETSLDLFIDEEQGIWHLTNEGMLTWADFASSVAERGGYGIKTLIHKPLGEMEWKARRPLYSVLQSEKGVKLPSLENALGRYFEQLSV